MTEKKHKTTCQECQRVARYKDADPEMYRGEPRLCSFHRQLQELNDEVRERLRNRRMDASDDRG